MTGTLLAIARREKSRGPMLEHQHATVSQETGIADDFRGKPGDRQVTVLSRSAWTAACAELGTELEWTTRRANLLVDGIDLERSIGRTLCVGEVRLQVAEETEPCQRMDEAHPGLRKALTPEWRGGIACRVLSDGSLSAGDTVHWETNE